MSNVQSEHEAHERKAIGLDFIRAFIATHGYAPTRREVQEAIGAKSVDTAQKLIDMMVEEGLITTAPGIARSIVITGAVMKQMNEGEL